MQNVPEQCKRIHCSVIGCSVTHERKFHWLSLGVSTINQKHTHHRVFLAGDARLRRRT